MSRTLLAPAAYAAAHAARTGGPVPYRALRAGAWARLEAIGLPHVKLEDWRFTNPAAITQTAFADGGSAPAAIEFDGTWPEDGFLGLASVALDGLVHALEPDIMLGSIAPWAERGFVALNTALLADAAMVKTSARAQIDTPVRLVYAPAAGDGTARATHPRTLIAAAPGSRLTVIEDFRVAQTPGDFVNAVTEILVGAGAEVEHVVLLPDAPGSFHVGGTFVRVLANGKFRTRSIALGGKLTRRDIDVTFRGEGGEAELDGLYVTTGNDLVDHHTTVDHAAPLCTSRELFKGVLGGSSRAVFNGAVIIRPGAQKSDAAQQNQNLLLSEDAMIDTKPELQIFADDVKCAHGATVGQLSEEALFYLRARGIDAAAARAMLTHAFAREVVERIPHAGLRADVDALVAARMHTLTEAAS